MTAKPDRLDMSIAELDLMIADVANRRAPILPVLRKVRSGEIAYIELTRNRSRILRLGPPGRLPVVTLVADPEGRGPSSFAVGGFLRGLFGRCGGVLLLADDEDELPYEIAASHAAEQRRHVVIVETPREAIEDWAAYAYDCGVVPGDLGAFINEPSLPDGLHRDVDVRDIPAAPRRPLN